MNAITRQSLECLQRVAQFCTVSPLPAPLTSPAPDFATHVTALQGIVARVTDQLAEQRSAYGAFRHTVADQAKMCETLRTKWLMPLARIAKALQRTEPGIPRTFTVPRSIHSRTRLLSAARAMARDVAPYETVFHANGFPLDGISQITNLVALIEANADTIRNARARRVTSTKSIQDALTEGRGEVYFLDAIVRAACATDEESGPALLRAWESVMRIERVQHTPNHALPSAPATPPTPPAPATPTGAQS